MKKAAPKKIVCMNCGSNCKTIILFKNKAFCCDTCKSKYTTKKPKVCEFC